MDYKDVLYYQEHLIEKYKYKPLPRSFRWEALRFYNDNLPERFCLNGANEPLFTDEGLKICNRYNRIVIGDYGAYVEILPEDILHENIKVKEGQEYRDYDEKYSEHTKYSWLTSKDGSDIKIYFQKKKVDYADYIPGRYYISPYECSFSNVYDKSAAGESVREKIASWLNKQGVGTDELINRYVQLSGLYYQSLVCAMEKNMFPYDFEYWIKLNDLCDIKNGLSYEQYEAVRYNLDLIEVSLEEIKGPFSDLGEDVQTVINMGLETFALPFEAQSIDSKELRQLLNMSVDKLLAVAHLSKMFAGCKGEYFPNADYSVSNVNELILDASKRVSNDLTSKNKEPDRIF